MRLWVDSEGKSCVDVTEVGSYRYARDPSTKVLMVPYALEDDEPELWFPSDPVPTKLADALADPAVEKVAWNAAFDRLVFKYVLGLPIPTSQWVDGAVLGRYHSLPSALENVGSILKISAEDAKLDGHALIKTFCVPYIPAQDRPLFGRTEAVFLDEKTNPEEWAKFCAYAKNDIRAMRAIVHFLDKVSPLPESERLHYLRDQEINDRGIPADITLINGAQCVIQTEKKRLWDDLVRLTHLDNPNSDQQILGWARQNGYSFSRIGKTFVTRALAGESPITDDCRQVLELRTQLAKSAVDKFDAFEKMLVDGRLYHQFVFMGAPRTGRYASRGVNLQNLLRPTKVAETSLDEIVTLVRAGDANALHQRFQSSSVLDLTASCLRPVFKARPGCRFIIADLSQIESVVLGWISNCKRILRVFTATDGRNDSYVDFATELFGLPYEQITKEQRAKAKPPTLGCGYRLSAGKEETNAEGDTYRTGLLGYAESMGISMTQAEAARAVKIFREKFPEVPQLWYAWERAFILAVEGEPSTAGRCRFEVKEGILRVQLPSGRYLHYFKPRVSRYQAETRDGRSYEKKSLYYHGQDAATHQWVEMDTHGGPGTENICQAIARDVLLEGIRRAEDSGFRVVAHVHDEIIAEVPYSSFLTVEDLEECMAAPIEWAPGLPLKAAGFESECYRKSS